MYTSLNPASFVFPSEMAAAAISYRSVKKRRLNGVVIAAKDNDLGLFSATREVSWLRLHGQKAGLYTKSLPWIGRRACRSVVSMPKAKFWSLHKVNVDSSFSCVCLDVTSSMVKYDQ